VWLRATPPGARIVAVVVGLTVGLVAGVASAQVDSQDSVQVAAGRFAGRTWSLSLANRHDRRCYDLHISNGQFGSTLRICTPDARVRRIWKPLYDSSDGHSTIGLALTSPRVRSVRLLIGHPNSGRHDNWVHKQTRGITKRQVHRAHVKRNFRFVVLHSRGTLCERQVVAFDRKGQRIDKRRVPCEF
jgi:hypothetical protein